jgi:hypothetical protein
MGRQFSATGVYVKDNKMTKMQIDISASGGYGKVPSLGKHVIRKQLRKQKVRSRKGTTHERHDKLPSKPPRRAWIRSEMAVKADAVVGSRSPRSGSRPGSSRQYSGQHEFLATSRRRPENSDGLDLFQTSDGAGLD